MPSGDENLNGNWWFRKLLHIFLTRGKIYEDKFKRLEWEKSNWKRFDENYWVRILKIEMILDIEGNSFLLFFWIFKILFFKLKTFLNFNLEFINLFLEIWLINQVFLFQNDKFHFPQCSHSFHNNFN